MMNNITSLFSPGMGAPAWLPLAGLALVALILWSMFWKGLALWHSARRGESLWFVILLLVNTAGILEIVYLLVLKKIKPSDLFK